MSAPRHAGDEPRDAHLLAALRHAPDHDVAPAAELSARIQAQARQAVDTRRPAPAASPGLLERWFGIQPPKVREETLLNCVAVKR